MLKEAGTKNNPLLMQTRTTTSNVLTMIAVRDFLLLKDLHLDHLYNNTLTTLLLATMTMLLVCTAHIHIKTSTPPLSRMAAMVMEYGHEKRKKVIKDPVVQDPTLSYRSILMRHYIQEHPKIYHPSASTAIRTTCCGILSQGKTQMTSKHFHMKIHIVNTRTLATTKNAALRLTPT
jgi:hypothetical protein